jgi:UDP-N-acetyl-2-amino-2-deoxyglucuronate dehydrogenase
MTTRWTQGEPRDAAHPSQYLLVMFDSITGRPIRIAVVGCGRIAARHFEAIAQHAGELELVAVCDSDPGALEANTRGRSVPGFLRYDDCLRSAHPDVAALCTPSGLHPAQTITAAAHGVHIVTEKPMATRWADGLAMVRACDEASTRLFVVKQNRRNRTLQLLKQAIDERRFGRIYMVSINVFWTRPQEYYDSAKWRGTWELDGGALMNQASHYVDLLDWLVGPVASVHAMTGTLARNIQVEDTAVMNIRWRNGALGSMSVTMLAYPRNLEGSITVLGEKGTVRIGGVAVNTITDWTFADERDYDDGIGAASYETDSVYGFGHALYYQNVIQTLRGTAESDTDGREGLKSLEILIAAYLSARDGQAVSLPLEY